MSIIKIVNLTLNVAVFFFCFLFSSVVFFNAMHMRERVEADRGNCLDGKCPFVGFTNSDGDRTDTDCSERFYAKYSKSPVLVSYFEVYINSTSCTYYSH